MAASHVVFHDILKVQAELTAPADLGWIDAAICGGRFDDTYFPEEGTPSAGALAACNACQVSRECLVAGIRSDIDDQLAIGWWGGVGPAERLLLIQHISMPALRPARELPEDPARAALVLRRRGRTVVEIASELHCSERTVYRYLAARAA